MTFSVKYILPIVTAHLLLAAPWDALAGQADTVAESAPDVTASPAMPMAAASDDSSVATHEAGMLSFLAPGMMAWLAWPLVASLLLLAAVNSRKRVRRPIARVDAPAGPDIQSADVRRPGISPNLQ